MRERMLTMEAELRALREELISRPSKPTKARTSNDDPEASNGASRVDAAAPIDETSASAAKRARLSQTSDDGGVRTTNVDSDVKNDADKETSTSGKDKMSKPPS